jgi:hypothetical protein
MNPVDPTCPVCGGHVVDGDNGTVLMFNDGDEAFCDHCESRLKAEGWDLVIDYEEDHHRLSKDVTRLRETLAEVRADRAELRVHCELFAGRIHSAASAVNVLRGELSGCRWTMRKALDLLDDGDVPHARTTLAHALRLDVGPVYGNDCGPLAQPPEVG